MSEASSVLLQETYKNTNMGIDSIEQLMPKVNDGELLKELNTCKNDYSEFKNILLTELNGRGIPPKETSFAAKIPAYASINMNMMMDNSDSHAAEMMIQGLTMGIVNTTKALNDNKNADPISIGLANKLVQMQQKHIETLKAYL